VQVFPRHQDRLLFRFLYPHIFWQAQPKCVVAGQVSIRQMTS
jgi:hypothetical protein